MSHDSSVSRSQESRVNPNEAPAIEVCDHCGSPQLHWRKCKLICTNCRQINKSCADL